MPLTPAGSKGVSRRRFAGGISAAALYLGGAFGARAETSGPSPSAPQRPLLEQLDLRLAGERTVARGARVLYPRASGAVNKPRALLVLLHGLGETHSEKLALEAWSDLYGLRAAAQRLLSPPVTRTLPDKNYLSDERLRQINQQLSAAPIELPVMVCPVTPRPSSHASRDKLFHTYAAWIEGVLLPEVRKRLPFAVSKVGLDGCSMGGYVATELFIRRPELFSTFGTVQSAIGQWRVAGYVDGIERALTQVGSRAIHLQTSTADPFRQATELLSRKLRSKGIDHALEVIPGPHNQPWLREVGTLEMLRWHARQLG